MKKFGTDSSGRDIFLTVFHHDWLKAREESLGFPLIIVQGGFMTRNGGGAKASNGFHDQAGCVDLRSRHLTKSQIDAVVKELRDHGAGAWRRDGTLAHGQMDPHIHYTLGADSPLSSGARTSWNSYVNGGDGLSVGAGGKADAPDYEYRPDPLVKKPPEEDMNKKELLEVLNSPEGQKAIAKAVWKHKITTADAPNGRFASGILQRLHNQVFPKKK